MTHSDSNVHDERLGQLQLPSIVRSLSELAGTGLKFSTIYADPPWQYSNSASRGAAVNHYPTMTTEEICAEPVASLIGEPAHLHLSLIHI